MTNSSLIPRPLYQDKLRRYRDVPLVKILSGIRRCGKSSLLELLSDDLRTDGVADDHIIQMRYTAESLLANLDASTMYQDLKNRLVDNHKYYLLLDEIQEVPGWEKVVNSLNEESNVDIYVTGSNSRLLSSEISTYLSGRYVSISVFTLSLAEYLTFTGADISQARSLLPDYLRRGGFPVVTLSQLDDQDGYRIVSDIYNSVITSDIARRHRIANQDMFNRVTMYAIENIGKTFSASSISRFMRNEGRSVSVEAIYNYLEWLEQAFVIYRCKRYDLRGKSILKTLEKFYLADPSLKYCKLGFSTQSVAAMMENLVYLELLRHDYTVNIGKDGAKEIDFVASKYEQRLYIQVCRNLPADSDREVANLISIRDNYPKLIVTLDDLAGGNVNGVQIVHLADFLTKLQ